MEMQQSVESYIKHDLHQLFQLSSANQNLCSVWHWEYLMMKS